MYRRDYIVRMIEEYAKATAMLLGLKRQGKYPELESMLDDVLFQFTDLNIETCESIDNGSFLDELIQKNKLDATQLKIVADLLFEKGELYLSRQEEESANAVFYKAWMLYKHVALHGDRLNFSLDLHYRLKVLEEQILPGKL